MTPNDVLRKAEEVGLIVERLELGFRVFEADGRLIASQLPLDVVEGLILARKRSVCAEYDWAGYCCTAFPPI